MDEGQRVIVYAPGTPYAQAIAWDTPEEGDPVIVTNLGDTEIAIPRLTFNIDDPVWVSPSFDFAGFDFNLDFNFNLLPFIFGTPIYTITGVTDEYLEDMYREWADDELAEKYMKMLSGTNAGKAYKIVSNSGTTYSFYDETYKEISGGTMLAFGDGDDGWKQEGASSLSADTPVEGCGSVYIDAINEGCSHTLTPPEDAPYLVFWIKGRQRVRLELPGGAYWSISGSFPWEVVWRQLSWNTGGTPGRYAFMGDSAYTTNIGYNYFYGPGVDLSTFSVGDQYFISDTP